MDKILLFIPMYNCEQQITRVLNQIDKGVRKWVTEILVVNNISTDNGERAVIDYIERNNDLNIRLHRNNENYGLGGSHKVAFQYAVENGFDHVIVLHGDDQGNIDDIIPYLDKGIHRQSDCLLGARFQKGARLQGYSAFRTFGNKVYNALFSLISREKIYDLGSGLNCYSTKMLKDEYYRWFPDNLTFNYCMILASVYKKHRIIFFPISWREEDQVSNVKLFNQAIVVLKLLKKYALNKKRFMSEDHRIKLIDNYSSIVVKTSNK
ncbi:glycosyltransferase family 2 protein [Cohnella lubricantis]|uniref:Glycosyltransferase family 2 protein n=1 Tax=Cohnella lubricantis TaxID=2163172 RepID=A0A841TJW6_9BACL|nr:glycosyltransferase family 2 protein [Cohnella lubricantis]MBB6678781.1 glycosyltransferase family 2 protein [Cohnella lubricantis]MBP2117864.1 glycosyltransferase involved in cell wall biosynthesis [Cohnella lubricantis]